MKRLLFWCPFLMLLGLFLFAIPLLHADELQTAKQLAASGKVDEACEAFAHAATIPQLAVDSYYAWYRFLRDQKRDEEAVTHLQSAANLAPDRADWWLELGYYLTQMGFYDEALSRYVTAISIDPRYIAARLALAAELIRRNDAAQAVVQVREAISLNPVRPQDWVQIIGLLKDTEGPHVALATGMKASERWPQEAEILIAIGQVYEMLGETSMAITVYQQAAVAAPKSTLPHLAIARMNYCVNNLKETENAYLKALLADKNSQQALTGLGWLAIERGNYDACMAQVEILQKIDPDSLDALTLRGWIIYKQGKRREARKVIETAAKAVPPNSDALYCLAKIAFDTEDIHLYERWLTRCVNTGPGIGPSWKATCELKAFLENKPE